MSGLFLKCNSTIDQLVAKANHETMGELNDEKYNCVGKNSLKIHVIDLMENREWNMKCDGHIYVIVMELNVQCILPFE